MEVDTRAGGLQSEESHFCDGQLWNGHRLKLCHSFGIYPEAIRDAVIAHGDDAFIFCSGRHIAISDHVRQRVNFLERETKNRLVTAMGRSPNGRFLAVAEKVGEGEASPQISIFNLPKVDSASSIGSTNQHRDVLKVLHNPPNRKLDIIGLAFTSGDGKNLIALSSLPDCTIFYWKWDSCKLVTCHDIKFHVTRLQLNPNNGNMISLSGPKYLRVWEYNANNQKFHEPQALFALKQEKEINIVDHCWVLSAFLCAITPDGHVHLFEDGEQGLEHRADVLVHDYISKDEKGGLKAAEKEQEKVLAMMGMALPTQEQSPVELHAVASWGRGFVVGGDQGYLGVFKLDNNFQVESLGTFRMPGEQATIWQMCSGSEDTYLTILSFAHKGIDENLESGKGSRSATKRQHGGATHAPMALTSERSPDLCWQLSTFPVGQSDLAAADAQRQEVFTPVYPLGTHHSGITCLSRAAHRRVFATCGNDMHLRVWGYPKADKPENFTSQLSFPVSTYEKPRACAMHPLGFQVAIILEDVLRVYHLTTQLMTKTLFDLSLKHPGDVSYSNSGDLLAVTAGNDVILIDPWRQSPIHLFSSHLSTVNQVLFSDNDQMLFSCGDDRHGAIYGFDLDTEDKEKAFEHISKGTNYACIAYDLQTQLVVALTRPEGNVRVIQNLSSTASVELVPETIMDNNKTITDNYTTLKLSVPLHTLFLGTEMGSVHLFRWPLREGGITNNPFAQYSLHAHGIASLDVALDLRYLFSACEGGSAMVCKIEAVKDGHAIRTSEDELNSRQIMYRHRQDGRKRKPNKEETKKLEELRRKLGSQQVVSATASSLDEMVMVPKAFLDERLDEIRDLEERMRNLQNEYEYALEQKEQETQEKMTSLLAERKNERKNQEEKYDALFVQHTKSLERSDDMIEKANTLFHERNKEIQDQFDDRLSKEWEKQARLLEEIKELRDQHELTIRDVDQKHEEQIDELRKKQEGDMREWRVSYEQVCNILKSDGLKFEEALQQQECEYEQQLSEMMEHKRVALQVESEKSTTALKDGVSMKQTINMLQKQRKDKDVELSLQSEEITRLRGELAQSNKMFQDVKKQVEELRRGLLVKDENLRSIREQMKHLESFRFVLFRKVRALEEERDPLEDQVNKLKANVGDMYNEFVREFRQKQDLNQVCIEKKTLAAALQNENVKLRAQLTQLKKDGRRLLSEMETVLHPDTSAMFEKLPKMMAAICDKYKRMSPWAPPKDDIPSDQIDPFVDTSKDASMNEELLIQRELLFRKNQIAVSAAHQSQRQCSQDVQRLTSENAQLIAEMNTLRNERKSWQRSFKELEAKVMTMDSESNAKARVSGKAATGDGMRRCSSAPTFDPPHMSRPSKHAAQRVADTPYVRKKTVDQQEIYHRQKIKGMNKLPPMTQPASQPVGKASPHERLITQSLSEVPVGHRQLEKQGFDLGNLRTQAQAIASHLPLHVVDVLPEETEADIVGSFQDVETIQTSS